MYFAQKGHPVTDSKDAALDDLLARWHIWSKQASHRSGLPGKSAVFGQSLSNSQYDWENGIEDAYIEQRIMSGFGAAIDRIPEPAHTALAFEAKNLATSKQSWISPRLPTGEELVDLVKEARRKLMKELEKDGVLC